MKWIRSLTLLPWKWKLTLGLSSSIFLTFFIFNFFEYHTVSSWLLSQEETQVKKTTTEIEDFYQKEEQESKDKLIEDSRSFIDSLNEKNQLIRITDSNGKVILSSLNGNFPVFEPNSKIHNSSFEYISIGNQKLLIYSVEIKTANLTGRIEIFRLLDSYTSLLEHLSVAMSLFAVAAMLISAVIGYFLSTRLLRPLRLFTNTMKKMKSAGFQERMPVYRQKDEIAELSLIFNDMMSRIDVSFQQQKQFVEDASHELRTPISILEGHLGLLNRWGKDNPDILDESLQASVEEVAKLKKLVLNLLDLSRQEHYVQNQALQQDKLELVLQHIVRDFRMLHQNFQFTLKIHSINISGVTEQHLQQIMTILLDNSIKYSSKRKEIQIETKEDLDYFMIEITDYGIGIPSDELDKVFDRFYRVDKARSRTQGGTGLGLSIAQKIVQYYDGKISIRSIEGKGTTISIHFPFIRLTN